MIEKEKEFREEELIRYKGLRLISAEYARSVGIETETPVFISPGINRISNCDRCGIEFGPIVYQSGYVVSSQHFHKKDKGGIYYYNAADVETLLHFRENDWIAILTLLGDHSWQAGEKVKVNQIVAACHLRIYNPDHRHFLEEGVNCELGMLQKLAPFCLKGLAGVSGDFDDELKVVSKFKIEDGHVLFSNLD